MYKYILLLTGLLTLAAANSHAAIYKWVDEEGNVHYSQEKPTGATNTERMNISGYKPEDTSTYKKPSLNKKEEGKPDEQAKEGEENQQQDPQAAAPKEEDPMKKMDPKKKKQGCESAKNNLATMQARGQIRTRDADGNLRYLTEAEKQARIKKSQDIIKKHCK